MHERQAVTPTGREANVVDPAGGPVLVRRTVAEAEHDLENMARLYAVVGSAADMILKAGDRGDVFDALCRVLTDPGDFHVAWIGLVQPDGGVVPIARAGVPPSFASQRGSNTFTTADMAVRTAAAGQTLVVDDLWAGVTSERWAGARRHYGVSSGCAVPLRLDGEVIAVLCTYMVETAAYDHHRVRLLETLADGASYVLQTLADRAAHHEAHDARAASELELATRSRMHAELARIGQLAFTTPSLEGLFVEITEVARRVMGLDLVIIEELTPEGDLALVASSGADDRWPATRPIPADVGTFAGRLLSGVSDDALVLSDLGGAQPPVRVLADDRVRAAAGVVLRRRDGAHGVLFAASHAPRLFAPAEIDFLHSLAHIAGDAVDHSHANRRLVEQALHDPLTGLPNRTLFFERLEQAAAALRPGRHLAVLLVDLDGFKIVNDALGHDIGDQLLQAVADRIRATVRDGDVVARVGGDEFAVLCPDLPGMSDATEVADRLSQAMVDPFDLDPVQTYLTASIGITLHDGPVASPRALLRDADVAMYVAKESGRARYQIFDDGMHKNSLRRLQVTNDLRRALDNDEFELHWHPIISITGDCTIGPGTACLEALVRWRHPERGLVGPDSFIGVAEDAGLIAPIGEWVLRAACRQLAQWRAEGGPGCPDLVSVNVSAQQLARPEIVRLVRAIADEEGIDPGSIVLEVTETAFMADEVRAIARLRELRRSGFLISIDDFGTGYSSLSYLRDLPARALKIDRSFISRLGHGGSDHAIVEAIVALAHAVDLLVVAEGVETVDQLEALRSMGCDRGQGFLWTRPLPAAEVPGWLASHRSAG